jgi:hypothetical protein
MISCVIKGTRAVAVELIIIVNLVETGNARALIAVCIKNKKVEKKRLVNNQ